MKRSKFNLSHYKLLTGDMGYLYPITWYEALPGDTIQQSTSLLLRVSPLLSPVMHPVRVRIHHWFVPLRLIWEDFEDFITGGADGDQTPVHPYREQGSVTEGSLYDYFGVPPATYSVQDIKFSALPLRAYNLIFNEHYRDQDLVTELTIDLSSGLDTSDVGIKRCSWEKDYFTTSRPWEQKGTQVTIPLGDEATVNPDGTGQPTFDVGGGTGLYIGQASNPGTAAVWSSSINAGNAVWNDPALVADLSTATGISVNDLRLALSIQRYQEARAQYGSRYVEYLRYLGVRSSDSRLQKPEYLGGGRQVIQFSEVLQTAEGTDPVASLKGHGIAAMRSNRYRRFIEEHGIIMTIMSVLPKTIYANGLYRGFSREVKEDYFQRELQHLGDQEVYNREVYTEHSTPDDVFGYQSRYDDYRTLPSSIAGEFRSDLNHWHYARVFSGDPSLNSTFINAVPTKRVNASDSTDCLYVMANHRIGARRMLSKFAKPRTF